MVTFMAVLVKEAVHSLKEKEKKHLEKIFGKIEEEFKRNPVVANILTVSDIDNLEKLMPFIRNKKLKEELLYELQKVNIEPKNVKISIFESARELNSKIEKTKELEKLLYVSMSAFRNGEKISGKLLKAMMSNKEKDKKLKAIEVDSANKELRQIENDVFVEKEGKESEIVKRSKIERARAEKDIKKKEKEFGIGMPKRFNPGVEGPGI